MFFKVIAAMIETEMVPFRLSIRIQHYTKRLFLFSLAAAKGCLSLAAVRAKPAED